ncbi:MAG: ornithine cyclodeaminase family protein [Deltaproteobacteria bacterium]|nr:ornithine cyclodeaminase family protein [Deltaproteobacteria bacterium]
MKRIEFMYLSQEDVMGLNLGLGEIIDLVEQGLREHGLGRVENPPKPGIHSKANSFIHAMPAYYRGLNIGGMKWVSGYPGNRELGLPQILGLMVLNDMDTGLPVCVMDCRWITAMRTAAVTAVTAKYCARRDSSIAGIIGAGVQGRYNLLALKQVLPGIRKVKVFDINRKAAEKYRDELSRRTDVEISIGDDVESVARDTDVLLTATQRLERPLVREEWFGKGCLGFGLEASRAWYGEAILKADKFITDDWEQTEHFHAQGAFPDGLPELYAELGQIASHQKPGRENPEERILAINIGLALEDVIVANRIYQIARERDNYARLVLMEKDF